MNLANKVITGIWLSIDSARSGYGAGSTKTVYMRKANYQNSIASGVTGLGYKGDALGTFTGSFFGNSTFYQMTGTLFTNMAAYISQGNNTFTIYNPSPSSSSQGYSYNYLQWESVTITITYEEAVSQPSTSSSSVNMGSAVTIYTNRVSTSTTHTLLYTLPIIKATKRSAPDRTTRLPFAKTSVISASPMAAMRCVGTVKQRLQSSGY